MYEVWVNGVLKERCNYNGEWVVDIVGKTVISVDNSSKYKMRASNFRKQDDLGEAAYFGPIVKFVYCQQHRRIHSVGWCSVPAIDKVALISQTLEEAIAEWAERKREFTR